MKIRLIDFGLTPGHIQLRVHENDAVPMCICLMTVPSSQEKLSKFLWDLD